MDPAERLERAFRGLPLSTPAVGDLEVQALSLLDYGVCASSEQLSGLLQGRV